MTTSRCRDVGPLVGGACALSLALAFPSAASAEEVNTSIPGAAAPAPAPPQTEMNSPGMAIAGGVVLGLGTAVGVAGIVGAAEGGFGGLAFAGIGVLGGGLGLAIGLPLLIAGAVEVPARPKPVEGITPTAAPAAPVPSGRTRTRSPAMMVIGGVLMGTGAVSITGSAVALSVTESGTTGNNVAAGTLILGIGMIGVGIPLLAVGAARVPDDAPVEANPGVTAQLSVGPSGIAVNGRF